MVVKEEVQRFPVRNCHRLLARGNQPTRCRRAEKIQVEEAARLAGRGETWARDLPFEPQPIANRLHTARKSLGPNTPIAAADDTQKVTAKGQTGDWEGKLDKSINVHDRRER